MSAKYPPRPEGHIASFASQNGRGELVEARWCQRSNTRRASVLRHPPIHEKRKEESSHAFRHTPSTGN